jgi:nicotinamidase-related amidase
MSKNCAVIIVDLQQDYLDSGAWSLFKIDSAVNQAAKVLEMARSKGLPVFHILHENPEGAPFFVSGSKGAEVISAVQPVDGEAVVTKNYANSFRGTNLKSLLDTQGIKDVVILGAMSHMCVEATSRAAADYGYNVTVVHDAVTTRDLQFNGETVPAAQVHAASMAALAFGYAKVVSVSELVL